MKNDTCLLAGVTQNELSINKLRNNNNEGKKKKK